MIRTYAIGDIHGHLDKLVEVHRRIEADRALTGDAEALVIHLGDLVDRGPDSAGVISFLIAGIEGGRPWLALKGNHDRMMSMFLDQPDLRDPALRPEYSWLSPELGGLATLASYGIDTSQPAASIHAEACVKVPAGHRAFLEALPLWHMRGRGFFVHAGIRPGVPLDRQHEDDLLWIRREFHADRRDHGVLIVHGHTPIHQPAHYGNRVNLDSAAAFGGPLTVAVFEDLEVHVLEEKGRRRLAGP